MSSQVFQRGPVAPQMNITPLIDVVFLLIIFFMLVTNIIAVESVEMVVPKLDDPQTRELGETSRITVNVVPLAYTADRLRGDVLDFPGEALEVQIGLQTFDVDDLTGLTEALSEAVAAGPKDDDHASTLEVVLRADAALYYDAVQPVMQAITAAGIRKVNMVAYLPDKGPPVAPPPGPSRNRP